MKNMKKMLIVSMMVLLCTFTNANAMTFSDYLISKSNKIEIDTYTEGNIYEMYTFTHPETVQTGTLTDYRYIGNTPNNYVYFNCKDETDKSTCEIWRIIGVFSVDDGEGHFEQRLKIMRGNILETGMAWNSANINEWVSEASLNTYLNGTYYESLSDSAKSMIGEAKYYLGGIKGYDGLGAKDYYELERGENAYYSDRSKNWTGKVGLIYPSDYVYIYDLGVDDICSNGGSDCRGGAGKYGDASRGWMFNSNEKASAPQKRVAQWTITPYATNANTAFYVNATGYVYFSYLRLTYSYGVRPVVYLNSDIQVSEGDGSEESPYVLPLTNPEENQDTAEPPIEDNNGYPATGDNIIYMILSLIAGIFFPVLLLSKKKRLED